MAWMSIAYVGEDDDFRRHLADGVGGTEARFNVYQVDFAQAKTKGRFAGAVLVVVDWDQMVMGEDHRLQRIPEEEIWAVVKDLARQGLRVAVLVTDYPTASFLEKALQEGADQVVLRIFNAKQLGYWARQVLSLMGAWPVRE